MELASVILIAENAEENSVFNSIKNVLEQTYRNIDLIVSSVKNLDSIKEKVKELSFNVRFIQTDASVSLFNEALKLVSGDVIFYKTVNNVLWYPRHIESHLEDLKYNKTCKYALSHCEYRNVDIPDHPLNTIGYRIANPPKVEEIILDEIVHVKNVQVDWSKCVEIRNNQPMFMPGIILKQWTEAGLRGCMPNEITVVQWIKFGNNQQASMEDVAKQIGAPKSQEMKEEFKEENGEISIVRNFPTIVGNAVFKEYNKKIYDIVKTTTDIVDIGIKRTVGMGDVLLVEPIIKKLREKYKNSKITLYTAKKDVVEYFYNKPDNMVTIEENKLLEDILSDTKHQLKIDLDLSYESRANRPFIDSYADVANITFNDYRDKYPKFSDDKSLYNDFSHLQPYVVVVADGSGWIGKTWGQQKYASVISHLQSKGYKVVEPGFSDFSGLTDSVYNKADFKTLISLIRQAKLYVGNDSGTMHLARTFDIPSVVINGAVSTYISNPNRENIFYVANNTLNCLHCKGKQFFNLMNGGQLTFVPQCTNDSQGICMTSVQPEHVINSIEKIFSTVKCISCGNESNFYVNIPGWSYFKCETCELVQREKIDEHPDQDTNIYEQYINRVSEIEEYGQTMVDRVKKYKQNGKYLDWGCSLGCTVKKAVEAGFDAHGIDLHKPSIDEAKKLYPELDNSGRLVCGDVKNDVLKENWDVITSDQVFEHISDPNSYLIHLHSILKNDGILIIGTPNIDSKEAKLLYQKWGQFGTGEHSVLYSKNSFENVIKSTKLFNLEFLEDTENGILALLKKIRD